MPRTKGSKNKFITITLKELNVIFKEDAEIKISTEYSPFFKGVGKKRPAQVPSKFSFEEVKL